jgi:hypothetical protein
MDLRGGCTQWQMVAKQWMSPQCWEGKTSAWRLRGLDRAPEVTTKLAEASVVRGGRRRCLAEVTAVVVFFLVAGGPVRHFCFFDEVTGWLGLQKCFMRSW